MEVGKSLGPAAPGMGSTMPQSQPQQAPTGAGPNLFQDIQQKTIVKPTDEKSMSIGDKLNQMAGIAKEDPFHKPKNEMGKDAFLKLFMEQLKQQDPLNPVKNDQFNQQMAMFSQLEQQVNMNKNLEKMIAQGSNTQVAALQLVGKDITADRSALYHETNKFTAMNFKIPQDIKEMKVEIQDQNGNPVRTYNLEGRQAGDMVFKWDGKDDQEQQAPTGKYVYKVTGTGIDGKDFSINNKVEGRVTGVTNSQGAVFLLVGEQRVPLNDVQVIKEAAAPVAAAPTRPLAPGEVAPVTPVTTAVTKAPAGANNKGQPSSEDMQRMMQEAQAMMGGKPAAAVGVEGKNDKNYSLSHDSFQDVPDEASTAGNLNSVSNDKEVVGTKPESKSTEVPDVRSEDNDFDGGLPSLVPPLAR